MQGSRLFVIGGDRMLESTQTKRRKVVTNCAAQKSVRDVGAKHPGIPTSSTPTKQPTHKIVLNTDEQMSRVFECVRLRKTSNNFLIDYGRRSTSCNTIRSSNTELNDRDNACHKPLLRHTINTTEIRGRFKGAVQWLSDNTALANTLTHTHTHTTHYAHRHTWKDT